MIKYIKQNFIAIDQLVNTIFLGWADETISARAYRNRNKSKYWKILMYFINLLFLSSKHCELSYINEKLRLQSPPEER